MARSFQVVVDCADPDRMAAFWAEALGYRIDRPAGHTTWAEFQVGQGFSADERIAFAAVRNPDGPERVCFIGVPEAKRGKNRLHLDIQATVPGEPGAANAVRVDELVARLRELGATALRTGRERGQYFVTMADIEGNEFCVH